MELTHYRPKHCTNRVKPGKQKPSSAGAASQQENSTQLSKNEAKEWQPTRPEGKTDTDAGQASISASQPESQGSQYGTAAKESQDGMSEGKNASKGSKAVAKVAKVSNY